MSSAPRLKLAIFLLLAVVLAVEPTFHNHSLIPGGGDEAASVTARQTVCAACAIGAGGITLPTPAVAAPVLVLYALIVFVVLSDSKRFQLALPSRAPPTV